MPDLANLLGALQYGDSFFPSGSVSFSWGLETLHSDRMVVSAGELAGFVEGQLRHRWATCDACALTAAFRADGQLDRVAAVDDIVEAMTLATELREGSKRSGASLLNVHAKLETPGALEYRERVRKRVAHGHLPVVQGTLWRAVGMPEETLAATRNMWFHTGDRVIRQEDGRFHFVDRIKDVIRRRGENISSFDIENILNAHTSIAIAAAYPVPSELAEDEVMIAVQLTEGRSLTEREIIDYCLNRMPYFAVPRFVKIVPELPRTPNGKVEKFKLRAQGRSAGTWDREEHGMKVSR